jgi:hypothetical protein
MPPILNVGASLMGDQHKEPKQRNRQQRLRYSVQKIQLARRDGTCQLHWAHPQNSSRDFGAGGISP